MPDSSFVQMRPTAGRIRGFTLAELLVSITVLVLLLIVCLQITTQTQDISIAGQKRLGADSEFRTVFDRIALDIAQMVKRPDVDCVLNHQANAAITINDSLFFYSEAPAVAVPSSTVQQQNSVSLVGYRINSQYQLERLGMGLNWSATSANPNTGMVFLTYANYPVTQSSIPVSGSTLSTAFPTVVSNGSTDSNYHVIGPDIFRFDFCYLLNAYTDFSGAFHPAAYSNVPYNANLGHISTTGIGLTDVQAFVVTIAILDATSQKAIPSGTSLSTAFGLFPNPKDSDLVSTPPVLPATTWQNVISSGTFSASAGIPKGAANQVRIYQRAFPLNIP
jgi:hypothetical protein